MKPFGILLVAWIGYLAGKSDWRSRPGLVAATILMAGMCQVLVRVVLPHEAIEQFASDPPSSIVLIPIAALETVGIWLPVLLVPWGVIRTRALVAAYVIAAATLGALVYYQPFDVVILNGKVLGPTHPEYEASLLVSLILASVPFVGGILMRRRQRSQAQPDTPLQPTSDGEVGTR